MLLTVIDSKSFTHLLLNIIEHLILLDYQVLIGQH